MSDRESAARLAAIANLPAGWVIDDAEWSQDLILQAVGPEGDEIEVSVVAGSLPLKCELDATEGYPEVFAGTLRFPHLVHKGDEVSLVIAFSARQ